MATPKQTMQFKIRTISPDKRWQIVAFTPSGRCYFLSHGAADDILQIGDFTYAYALQCWREDRKAWLPDLLGGANCEVWLTSTK